MKKLTITLLNAMFCLGLAVNANAQSVPNVDGNQPPAADSGNGTSSLTANAAAQAVTAGTVVIGKQFTLNPGQYQDFRLGTNYSLDYSSKVAISLLSEGHNLAGTFMVPYFAAPGAIYTAIDLIDCSRFTYSTQGGAVVSVYGSHLVIRVYNLSNRPVTYTQLMVHWSAN